MNIRKVAGTGDSKEKLTYNFLDVDNQFAMLPGAFTSGNRVGEASYYRLKMVDIDGIVGFSKVIYV